MRASLAVALATCSLAACSNDPVYIPAPMAVEAGGDDAIFQTSLTLPIKLETAADMAERMRRAAALMVEVPYVKIGDIEVSVEWKITNLTGMDGEVLLQLNGANEYFEYDPVRDAVGLDQNEPQPPGLEGDVPLHIPPNGTLTGLFREDQFREASIDLEQITRGNINPFRATLTISKNATEFSQLARQAYDANGEPLPQMSTGIVFPREAFAHVVRVNMVFKPDRLMRFEYTVSVRDNRGIMHDELDSAPIAELTMFNPAIYVPPAPPP